MIYQDMHKLGEIIQLYKKFSRIVCTSGGFDPLHVGHMRCLWDCKHNINETHPTNPHYRTMDTLCVVIVNDTSFLLRKKGYEIIPLTERLEMVNLVKGVDYVVPWKCPQNTQNVAGALSILRPHIFAKGGDRDASRMDLDELATCQKYNIEVVYGVGGDKVNSSTNICQKIYATMYNAKLDDMYAIPEKYSS